MKNIYLPHSNTFLAAENQSIYGFVSMVDNYLAALFVSSDKQGEGIGTLLLNYVKGCHKGIELKVFKENLRAVQFYKDNGFFIKTETVNKETKKNEYLMRWER